MQVRSAWQVTKDVYYALLMRELSRRLFDQRFAWFWLFMEPILYVLVMVSLRTFMNVTDLIAGVQIIPWLVVGLVSFFMFRDGMMSGVGSINASKALFAYKQLKPIDTVVIRAFTQGILQTFVFIIFVIGMLFLGFQLDFHNLVLSIFVFFSLWLFGLGVGLVLAVVTQFVNEVGKLMNIASLPLLILSGAFIPLHFLPFSIQQALLLNPTVHAIELIRLGFFESYWTLESVNFSYLLFWTVGFLGLGIAMNIRFETKLKAK